MKKISSILLLTAMTMLTAVSAAAQQHYVFNCRDYISTDDARATQSQFSYDTGANTFSISASGANNVAFKMNDAMDGEYYIDSLCVAAPHRRQGIASALLRATIEKARTLGLPAAGILVDCGNPRAERLYRQLGFRYMDDNMWGGHPMRHLTYNVNETTSKE